VWRWSDDSGLAGNIHRLALAVELGLETGHTVVEHPDSSVWKGYACASLELLDQRHPLSTTAKAHALRRVHQPQKILWLEQGGTVVVSSMGHSDVYTRQARRNGLARTAHG
jgi:hypothetical protein